MLFLSDDLWLQDIGRKKEILFFVSYAQGHKLFWKKDKGGNFGVCNLEKTYAFYFDSRLHLCFNFFTQLFSLFIYEQFMNFSIPQIR